MSEKKRHLFAKRVISLCIVCATIFSAFALIAQAHGAEMSGLLAVILGFFGGELALLCIKTVLKKEGKP